MAIKLNDNKKGITKDWYIKIMHIKTENKGTAIASYAFFSSESQANDIGNAIDLKNITFLNKVGIDIFEQAYTAMKLEDEFKQAIDC